MVRRIMSVIVAFVLTGAPVATIACEAACAARGSASAAAGEHHSCHHEPPAGQGSTIGAGAHACGHTDDVPSAVGQALWSLAMPAVVTTPFSVTSAVVNAPRSSTARAAHGPPELLGLITQLRI
jgi:hypothetical protein